MRSTSRRNSVRGETTEQSGPSEIDLNEAPMQDGPRVLPSTAPEDDPTTAHQAGVSMLGIVALVTFLIQHAVGALLVRYTKTQLEEEYSSSVAVLMQELSVKLPVSIALFAIEQGGVQATACEIVYDMKSYPMEWVMMTVPATVYTLQMNLMYIGYEHIEAAVGQIIYQSKIMFTAVFTVLILSRRLTANQWLALFALMAGIVCVQGLDEERKQSGKKGQIASLGAAALAVAAACSAFASVFLEKMIKSERKPSLWLRNIQLAVYGSICAGIGALANRDSSTASDAFAGFTGLVWWSIVWQAGGGMLVALTIKYADNLLRCFAQGGSVILISIVSYFLFSFKITPAFGVGVTLVVAAIFLYGAKASTPIELLCSSRTGLLGCITRCGAREDTASLVNGNSSTSNTHTFKALGGVLAVIVLAVVPYFVLPVLPEMFSQPPPAPPTAIPPTNPRWLPPSPSLPPAPPAPPLIPIGYAPAFGCDGELNSWCRDTRASKCDPHSGRFGPLTDKLVARYSSAHDHPANELEWRCYAPHCLDDNNVEIRGCEAYCSRGSELSDILQRCRLGRYSVRRRSDNVQVKRVMVHLSRDGWKLGRFQNSVRKYGERFDDMHIELFPGVLVDERPDLLQWAVDDGLMSVPQHPGQRGDLGAALSHLLVLHRVASAPENTTYMVYEDNAIQTSQSEHAIAYFSQAEFDFFNLRVQIPWGTSTNETDILRMPNNVMIEDQRIFWFWQMRRVPNVFLSSYMVTPSGARKILAGLRVFQFDMSDLIIDQAVSMAVMRSSDIVGYSASTDRYFRHSSSSGDTRLRLNAVNHG